MTVQDRIDARRWVFDNVSYNDSGRLHPLAGRSRRSVGSRTARRRRFSATPTGRSTTIETFSAPSYAIQPTHDSSRLRGNLPSVSWAQQLQQRYQLRSASTAEGCSLRAALLTLQRHPAAFTLPSKIR